MPVGDFSTIHFNLDTDADVEISLYSVLGQKVASVAYGRYPSGVNNVSWSGSELESGMYILKMTAGSEVSTLKILKK